MCNGISFLEINMLSRVGIKARALDGNGHTFVAIELEEGTILSDATWDLANCLYGTRPNFFGVSYEYLQELNRRRGNEAHKLESVPDDIIEIQGQENIDLFDSIGFVNENGKFKCELLQKINESVVMEKTDIQERVNRVLDIFVGEFPIKATHLEESRQLVQSCLVKVGIDVKSLDTIIAYDKKDPNSKDLFLSLHIDEEPFKQSMRVLNIETMKFEEIDVKEFDTKYRQHELDTREPFWTKYIQREENQTEQNVEEEREVD